MDRRDFSRLFPHVSAGLSHDDLDAVIGACKARTLVNGDVLLQEGDASSSAYFACDGHLGVTVGIGGERVPIGRVAAGALVGEVSFVDHGPASATLTAQGSVLVLEISGEALDGLLATRPGAAGAIQRALCDALAQHLHDATNALLALRPADAPHAGLERDGLLDAMRGLFGLARG